MRNRSDHTKHQTNGRAFHEFLDPRRLKEGALQFAKESGTLAQINTESINASILIRKLIVDVISKNQSARSKN